MQSDRIKREGEEEERRRGGGIEKRGKLRK